MAEVISFKDTQVAPPFDDQYSLFSMSLLSCRTLGRDYVGNRRKPPTRAVHASREAD